MNLSKSSCDGGIRAFSGVLIEVKSQSCHRLGDTGHTRFSSALHQPAVLTKKISYLLERRSVCVYYYDKKFFGIYFWYFLQEFFFNLPAI
jgi:hypothetical protein